MLLYPMLIHHLLLAEVRSQAIFIILISKVEPCFLGSITFPVYIPICFRFFFWEFWYWRQFHIIPTCSLFIVFLILNELLLSKFLLCLFRSEWVNVFWFSLLSSLVYYFIFVFHWSLQQLLLLIISQLLIPNIWIDEMVAHSFNIRFTFNLRLITTSIVPSHVT